MTMPSKHEIWYRRRERKRNLGEFLFAICFVACTVGLGVGLASVLDKTLGKPYVTIETPEGNAYVYGPGRFEVE